MYRTCIVCFVYLYFTLKSLDVSLFMIGKNQRCSCSGFRFVKQIILWNRSYINMALNSRGRRMSEEIKMVIVHYLRMHLSVEAIRAKLRHFHSYMTSRQGLYICITLSNSGDLAKDSEEQETTAYFCDHF